MNWTKRWTADGEMLRSKKSKPKGYKISQPVSKAKRFYAQMLTSDGWRFVSCTGLLPQVYRTEAAAKRACEIHGEEAK